MPILKRTTTAASVFPSRKDAIAQVRELSIHLPSPPSANDYWGYGRGRVYVTTEGKAYHRAVQAAYYREFRTTKIAFPKGILVAVQIVWTRPRKIGDLDNATPLALDALQGLAYANDSQIVELHCYRRDLPPSGGLPGLQVVVSRVSPAFDVTRPHLDPRYHPEQP